MNDAIDTNQEVLVFDSAEALFAAVSAETMNLAQQAVAERNRFLFVLAGGDTPRPLYRRLANDPQHADFPWQETHLFWGDERAVPPGDAQSNYGMAREELLRSLQIPEENIHRIRGEMGAAAAAQAYSVELRSMAQSGHVWPPFDLVLLGLGKDGHTASLFPGSMHPARSGQATLAVTGSYNQRPTSRITLTPPVFNSARNVFFLVLGEEKAETLYQVLEGDASPVRYPARRIKPEQGRLRWYIDRAAASKLTTVF